LVTMSQCPNCQETSERVLNIQELITSKDARRDEIEMELEIAKVEIKDLKNSLEKELVRGKPNIRLKEAVVQFKKSVFGSPEDSDSSEEEKATNADGERKVIRRRKKKKKKKAREPERRNPTYWHPEGVVLDELDQALTDVAELQGQVKQLKSLNAKLKDMYQDAEVKHAMAQFKISKLEKAKRELQLEKAEVSSKIALQKLANGRLTRANSLQRSASSRVIDLNDISDADAEKGLLSAAQNGDLTTVTIFCARFEKEGADGLEKKKTLVNCRNRDGWTPLMLSSARGHLPVVEKLLAEGGDVNLTETDLGYNALHLASWNNRSEVVRHLVQKAKCPVDPEGENNRTPLMLAANWGATGALNVLLELGADPRHKDTRGKTAIDWARDKTIKASLEAHAKKMEKKEE